MNKQEYLDAAYRNFILEYSPRDRAWHCNPGTEIENTNTYFTVMKPCTDAKFELFEFYLEKLDKKKYDKHKYEKEYLLKAAKDFEWLFNESINYKQINK